MKTLNLMTGRMPIALAMVFTLATTAMADTGDLQARRDQGSAVIKKLNQGDTQPALEAMRDEFPFLAEATEAYALGDVWGRTVLDDRTRQIAAVAAFAAMGETGMMSVHAGYALNIGVPAEELKEAIYLVTVTSGFPRAIAASQALSKVIAQHSAAPGGKPK